MKKLAIYGAAGFGRGIAPLAREMIARMGNASPDALVFVSDMPEIIGTTVNGLSVISYEELRREKDRQVVVALADHQTRREIVARCEKDALKFFSLVATSHRTLDDVTVGEGAIICDNTLFTSNIKIGRHFQCNIYSYVEHDCIIGDFVTFAPRVNCNGRIVIEDDVYVGAGAVLKQGSTTKPLVIGKGAVIGMGAVVTKDVEPGATVVGNPARRLERGAA
ncbi:MAG: NeuD/PglB/VioB family sugar acetyltransferase [Alphaproteobacteria bacterium]|nr:NeuD/PglB/VioB family sugar acetyltransferase [Alphaproteobacteria bacterium]